MRLKVVVVVACLGAGALGQAQDFTTSERRAIDEGRIVYVTSQCSRCHGLDGRGSSTDVGLIGPNLRQIAQRDGKFRRLHMWSHVAFGGHQSERTMPSFKVDRNAAAKLATLKLIRYVELLQEPLDAQ